MTHCSLVLQRNGESAADNSRDIPLPPPYQDPLLTKVNPDLLRQRALLLTDGVVVKTKQRDFEFKISCGLEVGHELDRELKVSRELDRELKVGREVGRGLEVGREVSRELVVVVTPMITETCLFRVRSVLSRTNLAESGRAASYSVQNSPW